MKQIQSKVYTSIYVFKIFKASIPPPEQIFPNKILKKFPLITKQSLARHKVWGSLKNYGNHSNQLVLTFWHTLTTAHLKFLARLVFSSQRANFFSACLTRQNKKQQKRNFRYIAKKADSKIVIVREDIEKWERRERSSHEL